MRKNQDRYWLHILLFIATVFTTLMAGSELILAKGQWGYSLFLPLFKFFGWVPEAFAAPEMSLSDLWAGIPYSFAFLLFLTVHEFGHYFTAVYHKVKTSLPYYIPIFIPFLPMNIGSFGAVIRLREIPFSTRKFFDIGIAGPLAGFVVAVGLCVYGFATLPTLEEKVFELHPEYLEEWGRMPTHEELAAYNPHPQEFTDPETGTKEMSGPPGYYRVGTSLLFEFLKWAFADPDRLPPDFEIPHYPFLFVGFLTLFFTALNLLPIGQLDGGHVTYGLFGRKRAGIIARIAVLMLLVFGGTGFAQFTEIQDLWAPGLYLMFTLYVIHRLIPNRKSWEIVGAAFGFFALQFLWNVVAGPAEGSPIWLLYALLSVRMIGVDHPPAQNEHKLSRGRKILGWVAILIFIISFSPNPIMIEEGAELASALLSTP